MFPLVHTLKSGEELIIREAVPDDAARLVSYIHTVSVETDFLTFGKGDFNVSVPEERKILEESLKAKNKVFLVAEIDGEVAGLLTVGASPRPRLKHIGDFGISVQEKYWGMGIGSYMLEAMIEWAKSTGVIRKLDLSVLVSNTRAIELYKKFGFEIEGTNRRHMLIEGEFHDAHSMGMLID